MVSPSRMRNVPGPGGAPVDGFDHAVGLELFDDAHLVVDVRCELVWVGDRTSCKNDHACSSRTWVWCLISDWRRRRIAFVGASDRWRSPPLSDRGELGAGQFRVSQEAERIRQLVLLHQPNENRLPELC
jgi:hypothetical protein